MQPSSKTNVETQGLPRRSERLTRCFAWYAAGLLRRNFHKVRISGADRARQSGPILAYINHASWWDPLVGLSAGRLLFPGRPCYAPMDAGMLEKYRIFERMGFFGVERGNRRAGGDFLRVGQRIMQERHSLLMMTPQGRFADPRERPLRFEPGLGHLAARCRAGTLVPVAVEYTYWKEKRPEVLLRVGRPAVIADFASKQLTPGDWSELLEWRLEEAQDELREISSARAENRFEVLLEGRSGIHPVYDLWRRLRASLAGGQFEAAHGTK